MLSRLIKEHQQQVQKRKEENGSRTFLMLVVSQALAKKIKKKDIKRELAVESVGEVTTLMMDSVNSGVANVFSNQKKLEAETRALQSSTAKFAKQTAQWLQMIDNFNTALKVSRFIEEGALKNHQLFSAK